MAECYDWEGETYLKTYLECAVPKLFSAILMILVAAIIIFTLVLITKTIIKRGDPKSLEEIIPQWQYLIIGHC